MTLLFAYGSNMAADEMAAWCPHHEFLGPARLNGFRLELRRRSIRWQGGAADIVPAPGEAVWGAVYELPAGELERLDEKEGAGRAYRRRSVEVALDGQAKEAVAYEVIDKEPVEQAPTPVYAETVLRGARERGLPDEWVSALEHRLSFG